MKTIKTPILKIINGTIIEGDAYEEFDAVKIVETELDVKDNIGVNKGGRLINYSLNVCGPSILEGLRRL